MFDGKWYQIWVKHNEVDTVQMLQRCDPILQRFNSLPCAPDGIPIREDDGTVEIRSYNDMGFSMTKKYLLEEGFIIEREEAHEE